MQSVIKVFQLLLCLSMKPIKESSMVLVFAKAHSGKSQCDCEGRVNAFYLLVIRGCMLQY